MRRGFSLLYVIFIMLLLSGILALAMRYARVSAKYTADSYISEQARLLIRSAIERTLLDISAHNRGLDSSSLNCLKETQYSWSKRDIEYKCSVKITRYYLKDAKCANVETINIPDERSNGMVIMEIEMNATKDNQTILRVLQRTLQHP